jgi:hypothetical protein
VAANNHIIKDHLMKYGSLYATGVGGWLLILVIGLVALGPLYGLSALMGAIEDAESNAPRLLTLSYWGNFKLTIWSAYCVFAAISISAGYRLWKNHEPQTVRFAIYAVWIIGPLSELVMGLLLPVLFAPIRFADLAPEILGSVLGSAIYAGVWTAYLKRSQRVKNTFHLSL